MELPQYRVIRWIFPRLLAVIYLIAFLSWAAQYKGLVGKDGILPASRLIENIHAFEQKEGLSLLLEYPTLQRLDGSDEFAMMLMGTCCVLSVLVMVGVWQRWLLLLLWLGYLSLAVTGNVFMGFQWDALLLEAGLLAVWLAPGKLWQGRGIISPPRGSVFLLHWLLFRLMFLSGVVKIAGGDVVWRDMTALLYHYETQPLPNLGGWWISQWPREFHIASCWLMFFIELILPFALFMGRWGRLVACAGFVGLMLAVCLTGNYTFFNLLTATLALTGLDDSWWPARIKKMLGISAGDVTPPQGEVGAESQAPVVVVGPWRNWLMIGRRWVLPGFAVAFLLTVTLLATDRFLAGRIPGHTSPVLPEWAHQKLYEPLAGLRCFNGYGLFQDMTTERPEVIIEVSDDGIVFLPLEFKWKPGDLAGAPRQVAPHQPRLDWQMWFAALSGQFVPQRDMHPGSPLFWFGEFMGALLQQKQPVWDMLEAPPFPQESIRFIRARLRRYRFADKETLTATGNYWVEENLGAFSPTFSAQTPP